MFRFWFRVAFLMILAAACSLAYVSSAQFKNEYTTVDYSFGSVGDSGFSFAWVDESKNPSLECQAYDFCTFIDVTRSQPCETSLAVEVIFLDATDEELFRETNLINGLAVVDRKNIEIGTNRVTDFEWFVVDDIYCKGELRMATSAL